VNRNPRLFALIRKLFDNQKKGGISRKIDCEKKRISTQKGKSQNDLARTRCFSVAGASEVNARTVKSGDGGEGEKKINKQGRVCPQGATVKEFAATLTGRAAEKGTLLGALERILKKKNL